ncbi:MAG: SHOCT domain-containing protein [Thaumarchaeota archaeon]|nr:SHOCT domain-containing protein [Nitrososphaerota archaeon]
MNNNESNSNNRNTNGVQGARDILPKSRRGFVGWIFGAVLIVLLIGVFVVPFFFQWPSVGFYGYYPHPNFFFFPFGFVVFFLLLFGARWLFWGWGWGRGWGRGFGYGRGYWRNYGHWDDSATEILRQRYAKGEITKDQFDQMIRDLEAHDA